MHPRQSPSTSHFRHAVVQSTHLILTSNHTLRYLNVFSSTTSDLTLFISQCSLAQYLCCLRVYRQHSCTHFWLQVCDFCPGRVGRSAQISPLLYAQTATTPGILQFNVQRTIYTRTSLQRLLKSNLTSRCPSLTAYQLLVESPSTTVLYTVKPSSCVCLVPSGDDPMR